MNATQLLDAYLSAARAVGDTSSPSQAFIDAPDTLALRFLALDSALIAGSPFPAAWCSAPPCRQDLQATDRLHALLARFAARLLDPRTRRNALPSAPFAARHALELDEALRAGAPLPSAWMAPPQRLKRAAPRPQTARLA